MKLRVSPPKGTPVSETNGDLGAENHPTVDADEETRLDDAFLNNPRDVEDFKSAAPILGSGHAPLWPSVCCLLLALIVLADMGKYLESQAQLVGCSR
jgi:hypothetical protein